MNLRVTLIIAVLFCRHAVAQITCSKSGIKQTFPGDRFVAYGMRSDTSVVIIPNKLFEEIKSDQDLSKELDRDIQPEMRKNFVDVILIEVHGMLQFLGIWQDEVNPGSNITTCTRLSYFEAFRFIVAPTPSKFLETAAVFHTLLCLADTPSNRFLFKSTRDNRLFAHQQGTHEQFEITLGRAGTRLTVENIERQKMNPTVPFEPVKILTCAFRGTCKWIGRRQQFSGAQFFCLAESKEKFGLAMLYGRKNLVDAFFNLGDTVFGCKDVKCLSDLTSETGKNIHGTEVSAKHQKGAIYVGVRNGLLFSYRVKKEEEKLSEILFSLDLRNQFSKEASLKENEQVYVFSANGKETVVLICGHDQAYYHIYNTNPGNDIKAIYLFRKEMTEIKGVSSCRKADYDARAGKLVIFVSVSKALELQLTKKHDGAITTRKDAKLVRFDNYRGVKEDYDATETFWPLQFHNGRKIMRSGDNIVISRKKYGSEKETQKTITKFGKYFDALLYFPTEYIDDEYLKKVIDRKKAPVMYYGVIECTAFVISRLSLFKSISVQKDGCSKGYKIRALLVNSEMTIVRTKNGENVDSTRFRVTIETSDLEKAIKKNEGIQYVHHLKDQDFHGNSFQIAPNTFDTIHNIDDYTYYQVKPRNKCDVYFQRRKISQNVDKYVENYNFPAVAVSNKKFMDIKTCDYEMQSAMLDESAHSVIYVMKKDNTVQFATRNNEVFEKFSTVNRADFFTKTVYSTAYPYVLYQDKGPTVVSVESPADIIDALHDDASGMPSFIGLYVGKLLYRAAKVKYILGDEVDVIEEKIKDSDTVTAAAKRQDFEVAAFGVETEIIARPDVFKKKCRISEAPFFMAFIIKVCALDLLLTLILCTLIVYHRACLIPARRRFKIRMGILKHRRKRKLRERARRRLRKLNILRRRRKKAEAEADAKRQAALLAAAVGAIGMAQSKTPAASDDAKKKKQESSSSSSEMITAHGEAKLSSEPEKKA